MIRSVLTLLGWIVGMSLPYVAMADYGPIQAANRFPLHMMFLTPKPVSADLPPSGILDATMSFDYSNTYLNKSSKSWDVLIDMEMSVLGLDLAYGIGSRWAVRLDMPVVYMDDGFLDGFLENFHDLLDVGNYDRQERPKNQFAYRAVKSDQVWFEGRPERIELADITLSAQYELIRSKRRRPLTSTMMLSLKLPNGDKDIGIGSGNFDLGLFLPSKWRFESWSLHFMPGFVVVGDPKTCGPNVAAQDVYALFAGAAYDYSESWTWLMQVNAYSSPLEFTDIEALDDGAVDLAIGLHYRLAHHWLFEFSFTEDLTRTAPDFTVRFAIRWMNAAIAQPVRQ
jgi:hypothetical protein